MQWCNNTQCNGATILSAMVQQYSMQWCNNTQCNGATILNLQIQNYLTIWFGEIFAIAQ
jgi:hypothetical protein